MKPADDNNRNTGLYQFKETLYRTKTLDPSGSISVGEDELRILVDNFERMSRSNPDVSNLLEVDRLRSLLEDLKTVDEREDRDRIVRENFPVSKLGKATVSFASDLCEFVCPRCRKLFFEGEVRLDRTYNRYRCPLCNRSLQVTPIWVLKDENDKSPTTPLPVWTSGVDLGYLWRAWKGRYHPDCPKCGTGRLDGYLSLNPARLMESSRIKCSSCRTEFRLFSRNYSLTAPSENLTQGFVARTYNKSTLKLRKKDILGQLQNSASVDTTLVEHFWFSPETKIKEILLGYWYGANIRRVYQARRFGIELVTGSLYLKPKPEYFSRTVEFLRTAYEEHPTLGPRYAGTAPVSDDLHKLVLHSIAHALVSRLPIVSGVSIDSFAYLLDMTDDSVLVYETAPGGLGACAELSGDVGGEHIAEDFFAKLKDDMVRCTCDDRCKYCIAYQGCSEWNSALSRFALGPLLRVGDPRTMTWGF